MRVPSAVILTLIVMIAACGGSGSVTTVPPPPGSPPPPPPPPPPGAPMIAILSGNQQVGAVASTLAQPLSVIVTQNGSPKAGQLVIWQADAGILAPTQVITGADGVASSQWTLGVTEGALSVRAFLGSTSGFFVLFGALGAVTATSSQVEVDLFTAGGSVFVPAAVIVSLGTTVTWVWKDGMHSVISNGSPSFTSSGTFDTPQTYQFTFNVRGTYHYYCFEHGAPGAGMIGAVIVR